MTLCTAVIGDVVASRALRQQTRRELQSAMERLMFSLNERFERNVLSRFTITLGDEFQGLLAQPEALPKIIWIIEEALPGVEVRLGVGFGELATPLKSQVAIGMDGPVFHAARQAVADAKANQRLGGVFLGFGSWQDRVLNGFARMLWTTRDEWTPRQREVSSRLRDGVHPTALANELGVTPSAVYNRMRTANWSVYEAAADGWNAILEQFDTSANWTRA